MEQLETTTCQICREQVAPREQCLLIPCRHVLCFYCMIERQARQTEHLTCSCGSTVESHVWERKYPSRKRTCQDERREAEYIQESVSHETAPNQRNDQEGDVQDANNAGQGNNVSTFPLEQFPDEVLSQIFSFCPAKTLAALDLSSPQFRLLTPPSWEARALQRFGLFGKTDEIVGKRAYQAGSALLHPDQAVCIPIESARARISLAGTARLGAVFPNGRITVVGSDDHMENFEGFQGGPEIPLVVRDVNGGSLEPILLDGELSSWQIGVFGPDNDEIIVNGFHDIVLNIQRVNPRSGRVNTMRLNMEAVDSEQNIDSPFYGEQTVSIGCRTMLILARRARFYVFVPDEEKLLKLVSVTPIDTNDDSVKIRGLSWAAPEVGENILCCSTHPGRVRAWRAELQAGSSAVFHEVLDIQTDHDNCFESIAMGANYIAVSPGETKIISLYNHSGVFITTLSEGLNVDVYVGADYNGFTFPISMFATGEILVSSSVMGSALCIWDMKKGILVHRFEDLFDRELTRGDLVQDVLPEGMDVTDMVPFHSQGVAAFCTFMGCEYMWGFPVDMARRRELTEMRQSFEGERR